MGVIWDTAVEGCGDILNAYLDCQHWWPQESFQCLCESYEHDKEKTQLSVLHHPTQIWHNHIKTITEPSPSCPSQILYKIL